MFETREVALEAAVVAKRAIEEIRGQRAQLADQIERALMSMVLNVAEASRRIWKDRRMRFHYASGSAAEARDGLVLARGWQMVTADQVDGVLVLLDRVLAMLWRLEHPRPKS